MVRSCRRFLALAGLLAGSGAVLAGPAASEPAANAAPRVCLVLSGGGARGLAHVGVLRVLEEMHVPVACIAGTSMGAIAGGLYAAGYSAEELERISLDTDWSDMLRDAPDRRALPFRRKMDDLAYLTRWEFGFSGGEFRTPSGLVAGQKLGATLRLLCLRAAGVTDFDDLTPAFRAVATDIGTGEQVVLGDGDLAVALRASMAVPGLFSPVARDARLLVDGGLVANVPVEVARAMGADFVIAVDVGEPLSAMDRPESMHAILSRSTAFLTRLNAERELAHADVVIRPSLGDAGLLDFRAAPEIVAAGLAAARAKAEDLSAFTVDDAQWNAYIERRTHPTPEIQITSVTIDPGVGLAPGAARRSVRSVPGKPLDVEVLAADLRRLYETGEFQTVDFTLAPYRGGQDLAIVGHPKAWGPNFLRLGLGVSSDLEGSSQFNLLTAFTMTRLNRLGAELKTTAQAGDAPLVSAELYQPFTTSRVPFVAVGAAISGTKTQLPMDGESIQYRFVQRGVGLDLGLAMGRWGELRVGVRRLSTSGRASQEGGPHPRFDQSDAGVRIALTVDQLDRVNFPQHGCLLFAEVLDSSTRLGADEEYRRLHLQVVAAETVGRHTVIGIVQGASALGGTLPPSERVQLGGLFNLSGLPRGEVSGSYGGVASLIYLFRLGKLPTFGDGLYGGVSFEAGNAWEQERDARVADLRHSFAVIFGADTLLGPVYLAHGTTTGGKDSFYLYIGRTF